MLNISGINNGVVLDHIQAGKSMDIYHYLNLQELDCQIAIIKNAKSNKMGRMCVVLAGLPNAPSVYAANGELARRRALVVVERMERAKKLTHTQALELRDEVSALPLW